MQRVSVVGNSGSGKTTFARRLAARLGVAHIELDAVHHLPGWQPVAPAAFLAEAERLAAGPAWVVDGNYRTVVVDGPFWRRADTVIWLRLDRRTVMRQLAGRTLRRTITRQELWNGNRERIRNVLRRSPEDNVLLHAWRKHATYEQRFATAADDPRFAHLHFVVLRSHDEADAWLATR